MRPARPHSTDLCELPARELAARVHRREVSAVELLEAHLARIDRFNPALNAVVSLDAERARRLAAEADAALARGEASGVLHGVPMTLKDAHDVEGLRTTVGTPELDRVADADGTVAARLRAAGAIIIGHTNVPPWLADHQTANPLFGRTANPWNPEYTSGGSSGGAASALAAGMTPLEVGSDLVSSIRLPAHFCGVYGLKCTEHRVPLTGFLRLPGDLPRSVRIMTALGPMARDLDDLAMALRVIAGPDGEDSDVPPVPLDASRGARPLSELRIAVAPAVPGVRVANGVRQAVERVAAGLSDAGAHVEERLPNVEWSAIHKDFGELLGAITDGGAERPLGWYFAALQARDRVIAATETFFRDVDVLLLPPAAATAFRHCEPGATLTVEGETISYRSLAAPGILANYAGLPALATPAGVGGDGAPVGVQLVGPRWSELRLLEIARRLEDAHVLPGFQAPAGLAAAAPRQ